MELEAAIRGRRSVRQFTGALVPEETIRELLDLSRWAPSWANTQGWSVFVVTGAPLDRLRAAYRVRSESGAMAVAHGDVLHDLIPAAQGLRFVVGVALGVPDQEGPLNRFERQRAGLDELVTWMTQ